MTSEADAEPSLLKRSTTRRKVLAGTLAAGSVAVAYAALGDPLALLGGNGQGGLGDQNAIRKESVKISHLLRRAGFGVSREEHDRYQTLGLKATIDELVNFPSVDDSEAEALADQIPTDAAARQNLPVWWLVRMANTKRPLQEKMTFFWHGLLTSQLSEVQDSEAIRNQNEFFRSHAFGRFPDILKGVSMDPAMMVYLNVNGSQRRAPNENYARELMELFSLGIGNYTEQDVREAARAFTGWTMTRQYVSAPNIFTWSEPQFRPAVFDGGQKTFLGRSGNLRPDDIVDIIADQQASAAYVVRRLFSFFVYPDPDDAVIVPFVEVYNRNDKSTGAVVEAMLRSDVFYSPRAYRSLVKSPVEYAVTALKALDLQKSAGEALGFNGPPNLRNGAMLTAMGQTLFEPPNVAGWPVGSAWLNSATMFARLNYLNQVTGGAPPVRGGRQQPPATASFSGNLGTTVQALDHYLPFVLDDNVPAAARQVLTEYAGTAESQLAPEQLRGLVYLVLASPQFHLS